MIEEVFEHENADSKALFNYQPSTSTTTASITTQESMHLSVDLSAYSSVPLSKGTNSVISLLTLTSFESEDKTNYIHTHEVQQQEEQFDLTNSSGFPETPILGNNRSPNTQPTLTISPLPQLSSLLPIQNPPQLQSKSSINLTINNLQPNSLDNNNTTKQYLQPTTTTTPSLVSVGSENEQNMVNVQPTLINPMTQSIPLIQKENHPLISASSFTFLDKNDREISYPKLVLKEITHCAQPQNQINSKCPSSNHHGNSCHNLYTEYLLQSSLNHPHILKPVQIHFSTHDSIQTHKPCHIVYPAAQADLFEHFIGESSAPQVNVFEIATTMLQIGQALEYLHNFAGIAHCDIKPENIFKLADNSFVLADFGMAQSILNNQSNETTPSICFHCQPSSFETHIQQLNKSTQNTTNACVLHLHQMCPQLRVKTRQSDYFSPELEECYRRSSHLSPDQLISFDLLTIDESKADIFAFGMTFFVCLFNSYPYLNRCSLDDPLYSMFCDPMQRHLFWRKFLNPYDSRVQLGAIPRIDLLIHLFEGMLDANPLRRFSASQIIAHPWMRIMSTLIPSMNAHFIIHQINDQNRQTQFQKANNQNICQIVTEVKSVVKQSSDRIAQSTKSHSHSSEQNLRELKGCLNKTISEKENQSKASRIKATSNLNENTKCSVIQNICHTTSEKQFLIPSQTSQPQYQNVENDLFNNMPSPTSRFRILLV